MNKQNKYSIKENETKIQKKMEKEKIGRKKTKRVFSKIFKSGVISGGIMAPSSDIGLLETTMNDALAVDYAIFNNHHFQFENIVLEGGGMKGLGYIGAFQVLEEAGILGQIKRVCGVSIGSVLGTFLIVGYSPLELMSVMREDLFNITLDHKCGYFSLLPNIRKKYGWNPGKRYSKWIGDKIKAKTGKRDLTFKELYQMTGRELCIVVTNLSQMASEYFHVKTTPNVPIVTAVKMSTAIPGIFQSVLFEQRNGMTEVYVDGGLLCNYPVHAFDGWWLSMKQEDSFFRKFTSLDQCSRLYEKKERFGEWNDATIGILNYSQDEAEVMKSKFEERQGFELPRPPKTKHYRNTKHMKVMEEEHCVEETNIKNAMDKLLQGLNRVHVTNDNAVKFDVFKSVLKSSSMDHKDYLLLFGHDNIDDAINELDDDHDGEITYQELVAFIEKKGIDINSRVLGYSRRNINCFGDFLSALGSALAVSLMKSNVEDRDSDRTIGINTGYVGTTDFHIEEEDRLYVIECGARAARAFLREYCRKNPDRRLLRNRLLSQSFFTNSGNNEQTENMASKIHRLSNDISNNSTKEKTKEFPNDELILMKKNSATNLSLNDACIETEEHVNNETDIRLKQKLDKAAVVKLRLDGENNLNNDTFENIVEIHSKTLQANTNHKLHHKLDTGKEKQCVVIINQASNETQLTR